MVRKRSDDRGPLARRRPSGAAVPRAAVTEALTRALFVEWAAHGYAALSLEAVAKRARVGKAALYRRWPSKAAMVADRLPRVGVELSATEDQGSLPGDVRALILALRRVLRHPLVRRILPDLHAEMARSGELRAIVRRLQAARRERAAAIVQRGVERGELGPEVDRETAVDLLGALIYWRLIVIGGRSDRRYVDGVTRMIVAALRGG